MVERTGTPPKRWANFPLPFLALKEEAHATIRKFELGSHEVFTRKDEWVDEVSSLPALNDEVLRRMSFENPEAGDAKVVNMLRITSYNVCYTKLLRICCHTNE